MYVLIIVFAASLGGIAFMLGRSLRLIGRGDIAIPETDFELPSFEELSALALRILRNLGYFLLVELIRLYVRLAARTKSDWVKLVAKIRSLRKHDPVSPAPQAPNRFLKTMSDYKRKLSKIKNRVKEEEGIGE